MFMAAAPIAGLIGSPVSGALMRLNGLLGLHGWQWLFLVEGVPALVLGLVTLGFLTDRPADATWLAPEGRDWLSRAIQIEQSSFKDPRSHSAWRALADPKVLALSLAYFGTSAGLYTIGFWAPLIVHGLGFSILRTGFLVAIPNLIAVVGMILWSRNSDRTGERYWHAAIACLIAAVGMAVAARAGSLRFSPSLDSRSPHSESRRQAASLEPAYHFLRRHRRGCLHRTHQLARHPGRLRRTLHDWFNHRRRRPFQSRPLAGRRYAIVSAVTIILMCLVAHRNTGQNFQPRKAL